MIHRLFSNSYSYLRRSQASSDYDPSFVTEILLKEIKYSESPNQDINLLKDVALQVYLGMSTHLHLIFVDGATPSGNRYHYFGDRNFLFGDGLLSRGAEEGSSRT